MSDRDFDVDYSERAGFLTGKAAAMADWAHRKDAKAFEKLVNVLRVKKWQKANVLHVRAVRRDYVKRPERKLLRAEKAKRRRIQAWEPDATVLTCRHCGTQWCRVVPRVVAGVRGRGPGPVPEFCTEAHARRFRYEQNRRDPVWLEANRRRAREWRRA